MSVESLVGLITGGIGGTAALAIFLTLILSDKLHTDTEFQREVKRGEVKDKIIEEKDRTIAAMSERADAAVKASEVIANAFANADRRRERAR